MSLQQDNNTVEARSTPALASFFGDRQVMVTLILFAVVGISFSSVTALLQWSMTKYPVDWPVGMKVTEDFRLSTFSTVLGDYVSPGEDGVFFRDKDGKTDGKPDGEHIIPEEERNILGVGTKIDAPLLDSRRSNWYVSRYYVNTKNSNPALAIWQLDVTYYTGATDKVAHVPGRCMIAAGATPTGDRVLTFKGDSSRQGWENLKIVRSAFDLSSKYNFSGAQVVQYYTFSLNGKNEPSWKAVRLHMSATPWEKYSYFAKIQFGPIRPVDSVEEADRAAQDFVSNFLPEVLKALPAASRIKSLNSGQDSTKEGMRTNG